MLKGHNKNAHQSLINETPDEVFHNEGTAPKHANAEFEVRVQAGRQMAAQNNVTKLHKGGWKTRAHSENTLGARTRGKGATGQTTATL